MKRIGHLFERVIDPENLRLSFIKASRGKRHREDQRAWQSNLENEIVCLREGLMRLDYPIGNYRRFTIYEPKEREICAASHDFNHLFSQIVASFDIAWSPSAIMAMIEIFA